MENPGALRYSLNPRSGVVPKAKFGGIQKSSDAQKKELADWERKSFEGFTNASTPRAKLSMLGEHSARIAMDNLVKTCDIFFKTADLADPNCTQDLLDKMKREIASARENLFLESEKAFNKEI